MDLNPLSFAALAASGPLWKKVPSADRCRACGIVKVLHNGSTICRACVGKGILAPKKKV